MEESWKEIEGYDGYYEVSTHGRVRSYFSHPIPNGTFKVINPKILKPQKGSTGYLIIGLKKNKVSKSHTIHRLMALAFLPNPDNKPQINHIDGNKHNNVLENLEWNTNLENITHAVNMGLIDYQRNGDRLRNELPPWAKTVINLETGIYYESITEAAKSINTRQSYLSRKIIGTRKNNTPFVFA